MSRLAPLFANITIDAINLFASGSSNIVSGLRRRCRAWRQSASAPRPSALNRWRANPAKNLTPFFSFLKRNIWFIFLEFKGRSMRQEQRDQPAVLFLTPASQLDQCVQSECFLWNGRLHTAAESESAGGNRRKSARPPASTAKLARHFNLEADLWG